MAHVEKYICDICGATIEHYNEMKNCFGCDDMFVEYICGSEDGDVCDKCREKIISFIGTMKRERIEA